MAHRVQIEINPCALPIFLLLAYLSASSYRAEAFVYNLFIILGYPVEFNQNAHSLLSLTLFLPAHRATISRSGIQAPETLFPTGCR